MSKYLLGISGAKGSGKTTLANRVLLHLPVHQGRIVAYASHLKRICYEYFGIPYGWLNGTDEEKSSFRVPYCWKDMPIYQEGRLADQNLSVREFMQVLGTDIFRRIDPTVWIRATLREAAAATCAMVIIDDVRFPNEVEAIQQAGGKVVRLLRKAENHVDRHESERALDDYQGFDLHLDNRNHDVDTSLTTLILQASQEWGWMDLGWAEAE